MAELPIDAELRLAGAVSTYFRLIALDRVWTEVASRTQLSDQTIAALSGVVGEMHERVHDSVQASSQVVELAVIAECPAVLPADDILDTADREVFQSLLDQAGGVVGVAQQGFTTLNSTYESDLAALDEQLNVLRGGGHLQADLSRRFLCGLAMSLMAAGGVTVWVPPHAHSAASIKAGAAIYATNRCWEL